MDNPFERYGLDPREGIAAITQRLKELAEDAKDETERAELRAAWEELTLHPARRLRAALLAHPESRPPLGAPPRRAAPALVEAEPSVDDVSPVPSVLAAFHEGNARDRDVDREVSRAPSLESDPILAPPRR